jgi:hypothetical protein
MKLNHVRIYRVHGDLILCSIANRMLVVREQDIRWRCTVTLIVGDDLDMIVLPHTDTTSGKRQSNIWLEEWPLTSRVMPRSIPTAAGLLIIQSTLRLGMVPGSFAWRWGSAKDSRVCRHKGINQLSNLRWIIAFKLSGVAPSPRYECLEEHSISLDFNTLRYESAYQRTHWSCEPDVRPMLACRRCTRCQTKHGDERGIQ